MNEHARVDEAQERDGPSLFVGIQLEVDEIVLGANVVRAKTRDIREALAERNAAAMKQAADDLASVAGQMKALSAHLSSVIARHQNRNPKFPK